MVNLIVNLLAPLLTPMGVTTADLTSYVTRLQGYIYVILILLVLMVAVLIGARWLFKKETRPVVRWSSVLAFLMAVVLIVNLICYGPMYSNVSGFLNASPIELSDDVVANSQQIIRETGEEGIVLLKNSGLLPLADSTGAINVFGWAQTYPIYGGTGSGGSSTADNISILQSLEDAGYETNSNLTKLYKAYASRRPTNTIHEQDWTLPEPPVEKYTDAILSEAEAFSDTALIVIGRVGGEGFDLPTDMYSVIHGTNNLAGTDVIEASVAENYGYTSGTYKNNGDYDDFDPGESYLELSNTEEAMIDLVCSRFDKVIVLINASNPMELGWVDEYDSIGAVILAPAPGATGMAALGEILSGAVNPSGRTVDTFVYDLTDIPAYNNIGNFSYTNVSDLKAQLAAADNTYEGNLSFINYAESIYVGYKYYETASDDGVISYEETVQYPFGYGLSYTTFTQEMTGFSQRNDHIEFTVKVTNTGDAAGKDVVEVYFTPPYTNGGIEKASVNLLDFAKTGLLAPGDTEEIAFSIPLEDMASYDMGVKLPNGGYILEAGDYTISIRSDSHTVLASETITVDSDMDYSEGRASDAQAPVNRFSDVTGDVTYLSRKDGFANYAAATAAPAEASFVMSTETRAAVEANSMIGYDPTKLDIRGDEMPVTGAAKTYSLVDLAGASYDDSRWDALLDQLSVSDMTTLINVGGWQTAEIKSVDKMATSDCDGPAGLNNFITGNQGTAFPCEVLMAQTWSKEMAEKIGDAIGQEFAQAENYGWYGPAMNIHRTAFSGRNFEYYSEDGVLSGKFASEEVNSAAKWGVYSYIKHFALNDQETNRCAFLLTYADEQAMREVYLKPFEIVVKRFDFDHYVMAMMSSYNWLGTTPAGASHALLTEVLRDEWGFKGMVSSDYDGSYGYMISDACVRAGGDIMLGYGSAESNVFSDTSAATCVNAMRQASKNILYTVGNSGNYKDASSIDASGGMSKMTKLFLTIDVIAALLLLGLETLVVIRYLRKRNNNT